MKLPTMILAALTILAAPAFAHEVASGPHGGRIADAGAYHMELVVKESAVDVFLTDANEKAVPMSGFKGTAIFVVNGKSQRIPLEAADGTKLSGRASAALPAQPKGVVQLTGPDGKTAQARFN